jgi:hypothetical protein
MAALKNGWLASGWFATFPGLEIVWKFVAGCEAVVDDFSPDLALLISS